MSGRPVNAIKGKQGFQRTGRADPLALANIAVAQRVLSAGEPAPAPSGYTDIHEAFTSRSRTLWQGAHFGPTRETARSQRDLELASDSATSAEELDRIAAESSDVATLSKTARHGNVSAESLHAMAVRLDHEDFEEVICRIGENRRTLPRTMAILATSPSEKVKVWAAWHDNTPQECHVAFRDHRDAAVRQGTAENPGAPSEVLFYLGNALYEGDGACRTAAKSNASYPSVEERIALATSNRTPILEREMLAWDSNSRVRKAAKEALGADRPSADDLAREAAQRGFPRHICEGIARRKRALEDKTAGVEDA